jgi:trigger factor
MATAPEKVAWRTEPGSRAVLDIEIPEDEVTRAFDRAYTTLVRRVQVPGFRRGKAPRAVLERHVGTEALREEALKQLLPERYAEAVAQSGVSPIARPSFKVTDAPGGKGLHLTATVDIYPQVTLPEDPALNVSPESRPVTDAEVDRVLEDLRARQGYLVSAGGEAARRGDFVLLKVVDAPPGHDRLQPGKEVLVEVGGGLLPSEIEAMLEGVRPGDERTTAAAGTERAFVLQVLDVRRKELPPLDDAFARTVSDQPTLLALRTLLAERLTKERAESEERDLRERILDALLAQVTIDLPESMVEHEIEHMRGELSGRLRSRGLSLETYLRSQGKDEAGLRADLQPGAERRVQVRLVLDEVVRRDGLTLSEEEISAVVEKLAEESHEDVRKMQAWFAQGDRLAGLRENLLRQKAMRMLAERASGVADSSAPAASPPASTTQAPGESSG